MSAHREATFGTTACHIYVRKHVDALGSGPFPSVATAFAGDEEVIENGAPVERHASTDDQAIDAMCSYLEKRFGPRKDSKMPND